MTTFHTVDTFDRFFPRDRSTRPRMDSTPPFRFSNVCRVLLIAICCTAAVDGSVTASPDPSCVEAQTLVQQLGDDQFVRRELAMERLIEIGTPAITAVEEGVRSLDREVRYRSLRVLSILRRAERTRQIAAFLRREATVDEEDLPGWSRLRNVLGDNDPTRKLYAQMMQREWELLMHLERQALGETSRLLALRADQLQATRQGRFTRQPTIDEGTFAALLLVGLEDDVFVTDQTVSKLWEFCRDLPVLQRVPMRKSDPIPLRSLLGIWIQRRGDTFLGLSIAMKYGLNDGLIPAERLLKDDETQQHIAQYAILTVAKFGGPEHIPLLAPRLVDKSILASQRMSSSNQNVITQVCDVALATLWLLVDEDPAAHGFSRFRRNSQIAFQPNSVGFSTETKRQEALAKWKAFQAKRSK